MSCGFDLKDEGVVESVFVGQRIAAMDLKQKRPAESSFSSIIIHPSTDLKPNLTFNVREEHALRNTKMHDLQLQSAPSVNHNPETNGVDPRVALRNLYLLEQRILQVKDVIKSIISHQGQLSHQASDLTGQRQLVAADLTCIIIQLISTAGSLLPNIGSTPLSANPSVLRNESQRQDDILSKEAVNDLTGCDGGGEEQEKCLDSSSGDCYESFAIDELELKDSSYEVLQLEEEEILAPHAHFCAICGKGFKRDANLRMHMRGHGNEYKTAAALAKPSKEGGSEQQAAAAARRYSCPFAGCKRNKEHKKFQPLKTLLCVKNHYKRSHCNKSFTCGRCNSKRFSVLADLKTHEKHCGRGKWACSCGTTFSRKDKLFGHVALFRGHTPALPTEDVKSSAAIPAAAAADQNLKFNFCASTSNSGGIHGGDDGWSDFFSVDFDSFDLFGEFSHSAFDVPDRNLFFLPGESSFSSAPRNGEN